MKSRRQSNSVDMSEGDLTFRGTLFAAGCAVLTLAITVTLTVTTGLALAVRGRLFPIPVLHLTVTVVGASGAVAVAAVIVTLTTVVLPRGNIASTAGRNATTARRAVTAATRGSSLTGSAGVEAPRGGWGSTSPLLQISVCCCWAWRCTYLDLQKVVTADALIVHLVVGIVSVTAALVFDEGKAACTLGLCNQKGRIITHSLLDAERGAGMSQRTRRPYLCGC